MEEEGWMRCIKAGGKDWYDYDIKSDYFLHIFLFIKLNQLKESALRIRVINLGIDRNCVISNNG